jgi:hypothetical protein
MSSELSPGEIRAAAEVHRELGPEYSDAVVEAFLERVDKRVAERVDREVAARLDERLRPAPREAAPPAPAPAPAAPLSGRVTLLTGVALGILVTGVPSVMVAASAGAVVAKDETTVLLVIGVLVALIALVAAWRGTARQPRNRGSSDGRI